MRADWDRGVLDLTSVAAGSKNDGSSVSQRPSGVRVFLYSYYPGLHPGLFSLSPSGENTAEAHRFSSAFTGQRPQVRRG